MTSVSEITKHPKFAQLRRARHRLAWAMTIITLIVYGAFVAAMAWAPNWLGQKMDPPHATSIGIPIGAGVIVFSFIMTMIYSWRANKEIEALTAELRKELHK